MNRRLFTRFLPTLPALPDILSTINNQTRTVDDRTYWRQTLLRTVDPVLNALSRGQLRAQMPVEAVAGGKAGRAEVSHLEALGRSVAGLAPWLELTTDADERSLQQRYQQLTR
ncbi:MAG: DUF2264 domain-containing protein, partial [Cytophagaceae bacterium]